MDPIIKIVIVLFVLSVVWERINEFLKIYLSCFSLPWLKKIRIIGDTTTKYPEGTAMEQSRQFRILKLNLFIGTITAIACHADMIALIKNPDDPSSVLGWFHEPASPNTKNEITFWKQIYFVFEFFFGCLLTGAFISMGSKFWHDLLDILVAVKNVKRQAVEMTDEMFDFEKLPEQERTDIMVAAKDFYWEKWKHQIPELNGVAIANKAIEKQGINTFQKAIQFQVTEKLSPRKVDVLIPSYVHYGGYKIPTDVVKGGRMLLTSLDFNYPGDGPLPKKCGASISRTEPGNDATGTIGLRVSRTENGIERYYALTCAHVVMDQELKQGVTNITQAEAVANSRYAESPGHDTGIAGKTIGMIAEAIVNAYTDSALIMLEDKNGKVSGDIYKAGMITDIGYIGGDDVDKTRLKFCGSRSGFVQSVLVKGYEQIAYPNYPKATGITELKGLIQLEPVAQPGDSGAPVLDNDNRIIGIIVGSSPEFTYVIPIQSLRAAHNYFNIV
ncbi:MAG: hypothetical protein WC756_09565 [Taibaiella sp.]|jgi:hypothetical protein